jgi:hypothetical protein
MTRSRRAGDLVLSFSQLDLLAKCPQRYFRRYILREPDVVGAPLIMGRAFHEAMQANFEHKMEAGIDLDANRVAKIYRDAFDRESDLPGFVDLETLTENQVDWGGQDPKELREQGQRALLRYLKQHAPFLEPLSVEQRLERQVAPGVKLVGMLDLVTAADVVVDYKLVNYVWPDSRVQMSLQPTCYAALLDRPVQFDFHFITKNPKSNVGISLRRTERTRADIDWLLDVHIPQAVRLLDQELWLRSPSDQCVYCPHRLGCGYRVQESAEE